MYGLMLKATFIAQHFLIGKDFGQENHKHSHHYSLELKIEKPVLDQYNFIVDIVELRSDFEKIITYFQDKTLNELPEFIDQNPSLELFSKILWQAFKNNLDYLINAQITVKLWADDIAQVTYRENII